MEATGETAESAGVVDVSSQATSREIQDFRHKYIVRMVFGLIVALAAVSFSVAVANTYFPTGGRTYAQVTVFKGWLYVAAAVVLAASALLVTWSWSALGNRLARITAVAIPGAFAAYMAFLVQVYLLDVDGLVNAALSTVVVYGCLWVVAGPPLVLWMRRSAETAAGMPGAGPPPMIKRHDRMSRYERLLLIATAFPGVTALLVVVLEKYLD